MSFSFDSTLPHPRDHARLALGDVRSDDPLLDDETIDAKLVSFGYAEALAQLAEARRIALVAQGLPAGARRAGTAGDSGQLTAVIDRLIDPRMVLLLGSITLMAAALVSSLSRSGIIGLTASLAILAATGRRRLGTNPLRILDSKNPEMRTLIEGATIITMSATAMLSVKKVSSSHEGMGSTISARIMMNLKMPSWRAPTARKVFNMSLGYLAMIRFTTVRISSGPTAMSGFGATPSGSIM